MTEHIIKKEESISIIIPVYNEEKNVIQLYRELKEVLKKIGKSYEIIFVDDGSKDKTSDILKKISSQDKKLKIISFTRNFGKAAALSAGFDNSHGKIIITLDGDLQDDPHEIPRFLDEIENYDLVNGWKINRKDRLNKKIPSKFFNLLIKTFTGVKVHDSNCCFKAYRREVINNLKIYGELHRYIPSLVKWKGFNVGEIKVHHRKRKFGKSKYGSSRLLKGLLDLITIKFLMSYSTRPAHFFGTAGILLTLSSLGIILVLYLRKFLFSIPIGSRPYLFILSVLFTIIGIQFISLGLLGEIMISQTKEKRYIIRRP